MTAFQVRRERDGGMVRRKGPSAAVSAGWAFLFRP